MINHERIMKVYDSQGNMSGVLVPADIWAEIEAKLGPNRENQEARKEDLSGFDELMQAWNFRYPYDPGVECPNCASSTPDWRLDAPRLFDLVTANFGGLLVFHCKKCGATVRHKYFKDHMTVESSLPDKPQP